MREAENYTFSLQVATNTPSSSAVITKKVSVLMLSKNILYTDPAGLSFNPGAEHILQGSQIVFGRKGLISQGLDGNKWFSCQYMATAVTIRL